MVKTLKKRKYNKRNKIGKGLFKLFTRRNNSELLIPETTKEELNIILKPINNVKEIDSIFSGTILDINNRPIKSGYYYKQDNKSYES